MQKFIQPLTGMVLAAFALYIAAWYMGVVDANFALVLFVACVITGIYWVAEKLYFLPQRRAEADALEQSTKAKQAELESKGIKADVVDVAEARERLLMQPWWLDWTAGLFPVIIVVFLLRSFAFEPFKIPSGSMIPTLLVGDLILVNKYTYGLRLPVINKKITEGTAPQRGDVMVFRYPPQPNQDYIKRIIGVPGDEVAYLDKKLTVNGKPVERKALDDFLEEDSMRYMHQFQENLDTGSGVKKFRILNDDMRPAFIPGASDFAFKENCRYSAQGVVCKVPAGHYFMMGDSRDNSLDSRFWGFVPDQNIVGKAFFVWMNFSKFNRIGSFE
jgi:signal peptidase I